MKQSDSQWLQTEYAKQYMQCEAEFVVSAMRQIHGPNSLQIGILISPAIQSQLDFPLQLCTVPSEAEMPEENEEGVVSIVADAAFLPIADGMISSLFLPHVLETNKLPHQVLREVNRVLMPEGWLVLTGFNKFSFLGLQSLLYRRSALRGRYRSVRRSKDWLQLLGFEVVASSMFQYSPLSNSPRIRKLTKFLEYIGDRWFPMFGGGYMILAKKREVGMTFVGKAEIRKLRRPKLARATAGKVVSLVNYKKKTKPQNDSHSKT